MSVLYMHTHDCVSASVCASFTVFCIKEAFQNISLLVHILPAPTTETFALHFLHLVAFTSYQLASCSDSASAINDTVKAAALLLYGLI